MLYKKQGMNERPEGLKGKAYAREEPEYRLC